MYITLVPSEDLPESLGETWAAASQGGRKFVQAVAHASEHAERLFPFYNGLRFGTRIGPRLCELLRLAIAQTTQCPLCLAGRLPVAFEEGLTNEEIERVADPGSSTFSDRDQAVIDFALKFGSDHFQIGEDEWRALHEHFDEEEVIEIGMLCAQFLGFGRLVMTLGLEEPSCMIPGLAPATAAAAAGNT